MMRIPLSAIVISGMLSCSSPVQAEVGTIWKEFRESSAMDARLLPVYDSEMNEMGVLPREEDRKEVTDDELLRIEAGLFYQEKERKAPNLHKRLYWQVHQLRLGIQEDLPALLYDPADRLLETIFKEIIPSLSKDLSSEDVRLARETDYFETLAETYQMAKFSPLDGQIDFYGQVLRLGVMHDSAVYSNFGIKGIISVLCQVTVPVFYLQEDGTALPGRKNLLENLDQECQQAKRDLADTARAAQEYALSQKK